MLYLAIGAFIISVFFGFHSLFFGASRTQVEKVFRKLDEDNGENNSRDELVKKTLQQRETELTESLALIEDAVRKVQDGDRNYFKIIAGQLRALICFNRRSLSPLLLNIAEEKGIKLECFGYSVSSEMPSLMEGLVLAIHPGTVVSPTDPNIPGMLRYEFKKWLNQTYLVKEEYHYSPNEIIRTVAEKEGGVHYDEMLPEKLLKIKEIIYQKSGNQYIETEKLLFQTALIVLHYGRLLTTDPKQSIQEGKAAEYKYLGDFFFFQGDLDKAKKMHLQALQIYKDLGDMGGIGCEYGNLGNIYNTSEDLEKSIEMHLKAMKIFEDLDDSVNLVREYGNLGNAFYSLRDLDRAEEMYLKVIKLEGKSDQKYSIAIAYGNLGLIYTDRGDLDKAEDMLLKALKIDKKLDRKEGIATHSGNLGNLYQKRDNRDKAIEYYRIALKLFVELNATSRIQWAKNRLSEMGAD